MAAFVRVLHLYLASKGQNTSKIKQWATKIQIIYIYTQKDLGGTDPAEYRINP